MNTYLTDYYQQYNDDCLNGIQASIDTFCKNQISKIDWKGDSEWNNLLFSFEKEIWKTHLIEFIESENTLEENNA